tara:strand:- start:86 stop:1042 length:957 start_codon:yes stop_codon:yes gene_type:complete
MAVHTKVSKINLLEIIKNYNLGKLQNYHGIKEGIENTNYFVQTSKKKVILTIFENRVKKSAIPKFMEILIFCSKNRIKCPKPLADSKGKFINEIENKKYGIFSFLDGKSKNKWNKKDCFLVGKTLANLHNKNLRRSFKLVNDLGILSWKVLYSKLKHKINGLIPNASKPISDEIKFLTKEWPRCLPKGLIHADLFPDNVLFNEDSISGILDFYFSCHEILAYDLAITLNAWSFFDGQFKKEFFNEIFKGYETKRKLNKLEKDKINLLLRGASMRFLLTRLYDMVYVSENELLEKKNPIEFYKILKFHQNLENINDYIK